MPGCPGGPVVTTLVCFFILHARLRVHCAPGIPHALSWAEESSKTRTQRAAGLRMCVCLRGGCLKSESVGTHEKWSSPRKRGPIRRGLAVFHGADGFCSNKPRWLWVPAF